MDRNTLDLAVQLALVKAILEADRDDESDESNLIEKIFLSEEKVKAYLSEGNSSAAKQLAKWRYEQDSLFHTAPVLVQYYVTLVQNNDPAEAEDIKDVLLTVLSGVKTSSIQVEQLADKLRKRDKPYAAILFYQMAIYYCQANTDVSNVVVCLLRCCAGTSAIVREQVDIGKLSRQFVANHIIPYLKQAKTQMYKRLPSNRKEISESLARCMHCIEQCQRVANDLKGRESTLREATALLQNSFGDEAQKKRIYGTCLNNLGHTLLLQDRFDEAQKYFSQAITANQKAEDHDSIAEKKEDIQLSQNGLKAAKARESCPIQ